MSRFRVLWRVLSQSHQWSTTKMNHLSAGYRFSGNFQRANRRVVNVDRLADIQERLQKKDVPMSAEEWNEFRKELMNTSEFVNEVNIDATLLGLCNPDTQLRVAQSYIDLLQSEGKTPNYATIGRILRMYQPAQQKNQLTDKDEKEILEIYHKFRSEYEILDQTTCENLISALIVTSQWKQCLDLLEMIKVSSVPTVTVHSMVAAKAFQQKENMEIGWRLMKEMCDYGKIPKCDIFLQYFETIQLDRKNFQKDLEQMLEFIAENNLVLTKVVIERLQAVTSNFKLKSTLVKLGKSGQCSSCKQYNPDISVTAKEFIELSSSFMDKVLIRRDVFVKSSPEEVERFTNFLDRSGPYDCVIDGLNVAFSMGLKKSHAVYAKTLATVVKYFKGKGRKMLVLGRQHMNKWPQEPMNYIKQNANLFLTGNLSQDDPFLLYAALKSGPKADFVSRDLMRSHSFLLGPELKQIFRRWQQQHQYMIISANDKGKLAVQPPVKYNLNASKINSMWHIPFREEYSVIPGESFDVPENWLCLELVKNSR